jgi:hypothetical protein
MEYALAQPTHSQHRTSILTDRETEYCGRVDHHDYQLYLAINDIDFTGGLQNDFE